MTITSALKDRPFGQYERSLAFRYIRAKREHGGVAVVSVLSIVGVMLAVAALIIVMSIMNGFQTEVTKRLLGNTGHIILHTQSYTEMEVNELEATLEALPSVQSFVPQVEDYVLASGPGRTTAGFVRGFRPEDLKDLPYLDGNLFSGSAEGFGEGKFGGDGILLSRGVAQTLGVLAGDKITLVTKEGTSTIAGMSPRKKTYNVIGVFEIFSGSLNPIDHILILMPIEQAQLFFNSRDEYSFVALKITDPDAVDIVARDIYQNYVPRGMPVQTWKMIFPNISDTLNLEKTMMRMIFAVLITITALNIITGIVMLVKNKGRDIAILRTMGASKSTILRIFLMIGALLGTLGMVLGVILGVAFCENIGLIFDGLNAIPGVTVWNADVYGLPAPPAEVDWREVAFACYFALLVSILISIVPAWNAARLDPVDALRSE